MPARDQPNSRPAASGRIGRFFTDRWSGNVALGRLFWRDLVVVGTAINIAATLASLGLLAAKAPLAVALAVHAAPIPYNVFLAFAVWRKAERQGGATAMLYQLAAIAWLVIAILI